MSSESRALISAGFPQSYPQDIDNRKWSLDLPLPPTQLQPNRPVHHLKKARLTKRYRHAVGWVVKAALKGDRPQLKAAYIDVFYSHAGVGLDPDNLLASLKAAVDAMVDVGLLANDDQITYHVRKRRGPIGLIVTVVEISTGPTAAGLSHAP